MQFGVRALATTVRVFVEQRSKDLPTDDSKAMTGLMGSAARAFYVTQKMGVWPWISDERYAGGVRRWV